LSNKFLDRISFFLDGTNNVAKTLKNQTLEYIINNLLIFNSTFDRN